MIVLYFIALVRFHAFVYFWVNYMVVIIEFCFTCMAKKNQLMWLSARRVLKLRLLRVVTRKIKSIEIGSFM